MSRAKRIYRYNDNYARPRQESFYEDSMLARTIKDFDTSGLDFNTKLKISQNYDPTTLYVQLRAAAESGWDFSSRWFYDDSSMQTIFTNHVSLIDLNCLVWHLQKTIAKAYRFSGQNQKSAEMDSAALDLKELLPLYTWDPVQKWFMDYDGGWDRRRKQMNLAGMFPLFFRLASQEQADAAAKTLKTHFLKQGGVVTTLKNTGQQWDAPNGWAPLQWITIMGLENYGHHELAKEIAERWFRLNKRVFNETGKLMEKYDVVNANKPGGGGEYPSQDGFGWTNGVLLALMKKYNFK